MMVFLNFKTIFNGIEINLLKGGKKKKEKKKKKRF